MAEIISLKNVSFRYRRYADEDDIPQKTPSAEEVRSEYAVFDVSLSVNEGEFVAFLGRNGSGKSTTAKLLNGLLLPEKGTVTVMGNATSDPKKLFDIRKNVGMVFQNPDNQMVASMVEDDIAFGPENIGLEPGLIGEAVDWALRCVGMEHARKSASARLSGGQKQRVAIASALAIKPKILVLDESTAMLDPVGRREVLNVVLELNKKQGMTVILITHFMEEALHADRVYVFGDGAVKISGTPREVFVRQDELDALGLTAPFASDLAAMLRKGGLSLPQDILTQEELLKAIAACIG